MKFVGVDGCKAGWLAVELEGKTLTWSLFSTFAAVAEHYADNCCLFVDIPIGLPEKGTREADRQARLYLPSHMKSSIFNTPVRRAVYASGKAEAKQINEKLSGKSLSEQSLAISKKILDADKAMQANLEARDFVFESHPEICFSQLADQAPKYAKKDLLGGLERLKILDKFVTGVKDLLVSVRESVPRSKIAGDDVLDACVLAVAARECWGNPSCFPLEKSGPPMDETGLPMAIGYPA